MRARYVISWRQPVCWSACIAVMGFAIAGCSRQDSHSAPAEILNVYSWADFIAPDTITNFERETGIKVRYDTYESDEVLETKLLTGHTNYDIVVPSDVFFERLIKAGALQPLDHSQLSNLKNLDPLLMQRLAIHDPGNKFGVPYAWATTGIGYNVEEVQRRLGADHTTGWAMLFDPKNAAKLQDCGISVLDSPTDVFSSALMYLGLDANSTDPKELDHAFTTLMKIRPFLRSIASVGNIVELANGGLCVALGWSGDMMTAHYRALEAAKPVNIRYLIPDEGGLISTDVMAIPSDAPHARNAEKWLNYMMRPNVIADITNAIKFPNGNSAATALVRSDLLANPAVYPSASTLARLHSLQAMTQEQQRNVNRLWTRFRTGQ